MGADRQFAFGQVRFEPRSGEVYRDGRVIKLTPRAAAVLCALVESAQQLVTKQELFDRVWGSRAAGDDALTSCIQETPRRAQRRPPSVIRATWRPVTGAATG